MLVNSIPLEKWLCLQTISCKYGRSGEKIDKLIVSAAVPCENNLSSRYHGFSKELTMHLANLSMASCCSVAVDCPATGIMEPCAKMMPC